MELKVTTTVQIPESNTIFHFNSHLKPKINPLNGLANPSGPSASLDLTFLSDVVLRPSTPTLLNIIHTRFGYPRLSWIRSYSQPDPISGRQNLTDVNHMIQTRIKRNRYTRVDACFCNSQDKNIKSVSLYYSRVIMRFQSEQD